MAKKSGLDIKEGVVEENDTVGKTIIDYPKKNKMDLIVFGTKGMTAVEEYFFGSVVKEVFQHAHCPVKKTAKKLKNSEKDILDILDIPKEFIQKLTDNKMIV